MLASMLEDGLPTRIATRRGRRHERAHAAAQADGGWSLLLHASRAGAPAASPTTPRRRARDRELGCLRTRIPAAIIADARHDPLDGRGSDPLPKQGRRLKQNADAFHEILLHRGSGTRRCDRNRKRSLMSLARPEKSELAKRCKTLERIGRARYRAAPRSAFADWTIENEKGGASRDDAGDGRPARVRLVSGNLQVVRYGGRLGNRDQRENGTRLRRGAQIRRPELAGPDGRRRQFSGERPATSRSMSKAPKGSSPVRKYRRASMSTARSSMAR